MKITVEIDDISEPPPPGVALLLRALAFESIPVTLRVGLGLDAPDDEVEAWIEEYALPGEVIFDG